MFSREIVPTIGILNCPVIPIKFQIFIPEYYEKLKPNIINTVCSLEMKNKPMFVTEIMLPNRFSTKM